MNFNQWLEETKRAIILDSKRIDQLKAVWLDAFEYYGVAVSDSRLKFYAEDCIDFSSDEVEAAIMTWRRSPPPVGHKPRPPMPSDIINQLRPVPQLDAEANAVAASVYACIGRFGHPNYRSAEAYLGPFAWSVVQAMGGWATLCATATPAKRDSFHAQVRDVAKSLGARRGQDSLDAMRLRARTEVIGRELGPKQRKLSSIAEVVGDIEEGEANAS